MFWAVFAFACAGLALGASQIHLEENITKFFPNDGRVSRLNYLFQNSSFAERLVMMVSVKDSTEQPLPDTLTAVTEELVARFEDELPAYGASVKSQVDAEKVLKVFATTRKYLPVFLTEQDYTALDSLTRPSVSREVLRHNYQQLISPSGVAFKRILVEDMMGFSFLVLKKLQQLQYDDNFELYDNYIMTKDHRHLIFFVQPGYPPTDTGHNTPLINYLKKVTEEVTGAHAPVQVSFFGGTAVAVGNAHQLRKDTMLTMSLFVVLLTVFIIVFFRDVRVLVLILVPVAFGALFALTCIYLLKGSVSILALAAGSIILGIAVNYALHFLVHYRYHPDKEAVIKDLTAPMTLGSFTTVLAFFSLQFTNASVLKDIGLFAGFSLIGAAACSLIFLPHLTPMIRYRETFVERGLFLKKSPRGYWVLGILLITPIFFFFAGDVRFNSDMSDLNFMNAETHLAQERLETINPASLHAMYLSTEGATLQEALAKNERAVPVLDSLRGAGVVKRYQSLSSFLLSDSLQQVRIRRWQAFWTPARKEAFFTAVHDEAASLKFSPVVLANLDGLIEKDYHAMDTASFNVLRTAFFDDNIIEKDTMATIVSLLNVLPEDKPAAHAALDSTPAHLLDRQMITNLFIEYVHSDFNFIVAFTSILVFVVLLVTTGRIEITFITFIPMLITWIWVLGIMALVGIEFNIINVMISTFIFGLGDDYSIFVMDGLVQEYKTGKAHLQSVRASIFLSVLTTISGLGVLIFAGHPALRSIAAIAIIGIGSVFVMSQTLEPFLFDFLITRRTRRGLAPMTARGMFYTGLTYGIFVFGSFFLTILGLVLRAMPIPRRWFRRIYHSLISVLTFTIMHVAFNLRKVVINASGVIFTRPGIIIANHSSFLDILLTTMLNPRVILLTNEWVWKSPIFGGVVRLADYYVVTEGAASSVEKLKALVAEGYSIVVFPEGTRSKDGKLRRFHKGAFYLAEQLNLPIDPIIVYGAADVIPKSTIFLNDGTIWVKMLPPIMPEDTSFGDNYSARTKAISKHFKENYEAFAAEQGSPVACGTYLVNLYRYKGPVLEWYLRIKVRLERNYQVFHELVPAGASVLDLGCGYGFLCYTLGFLDRTRRITGVDYDEEKISVAENCYEPSQQIQFFCGDITNWSWAPQDVIIIADVMHYLPAQAQERLLLQCFESLNPGGCIIIRDGDADREEQHRGTRLTEFFSVRLLKFNKAAHALQYLSGRALTSFAQQHGFNVRTVQEGKLTSNVIFVISKE